MGKHIYYLTQRGPSLGCQPKGAINIVDFGKKVWAGEINRHAWGYVEYADPLTSKQIEDYELVKEEILEADCLECPYTEATKCKNCGINWEDKRDE